ncbi:MAG: TipAS antibiotic-recognition domain-containing protein [Clostridia bacterium]|nr:TipAS antibiotic-recognition domain-containing protein [Clostridia bacterium]
MKVKYENEVKNGWGDTQAYAEFTEKTKSFSEKQFADISSGLETIFNRFAEEMKSGLKPDSAEAQELVEQLQNYITEHFYTCSDNILAGLGKMYAADERFKNNIDKNTIGTAEFVSRAISCRFS